VTALVYCTQCGTVRAAQFGQCPCCSSTSSAPIEAESATATAPEVASAAPDAEIASGPRFSWLQHGADIWVLDRGNVIANATSVDDASLIVGVLRMAEPPLDTPPVALSIGGRLIAHVSQRTAKAIERFIEAFA
jgi:hypothetical protein